MAVRPVFAADLFGRLCMSEPTEFQYYNGFADSQKKKCIKSLHQSFLEDYPGRKVLEISSHSTEELGVKLSAFNLTIPLKDGREVSVECAFQAGKVFAEGGPYLDLLDGTSREAKKDPRLKNSGRLTGFCFEGEFFELVPKTCFYNWLYIHGLMAHPELADALMAYDSFTDIVFNPEKSANCQAEAAAYYVALRKNGMLKEAMKSRKDFIRILYQSGKSRSAGKKEDSVGHEPVKSSRPAAASVDIFAPKKEKKVPAVSFKVGGRIIHPAFGEGEVWAIRERRGANVIVVSFAVGMKELNEAWIIKNCRRL